MSTAPATQAEPPELDSATLAQIQTARTLLFGAMLGLLRSGTDGVVVAGTLTDCLAHLLAARPPAQRQGDIEHTVDALRTRVAQIAAVIPPHPSMH